MGTFGHAGTIKQAMVEDLEGFIQTMNRRQFASRRPPHASEGWTEEGPTFSDAMGALPFRAPGLQDRPSPLPAIPTGTSQQVPPARVAGIEMTMEEMDELALEAAIRRLRASYPGSSMLQH